MPNSSYEDKMDKFMRGPIIPREVEEEKFEDTIFFPDADATEEEIEQVIKYGDVLDE